MSDLPTTAASKGNSKVFWWILAVTALAGCVGIAVMLNGDAPRSQSVAKLPAPPPLILRDSTSNSSLLGRGAQLLTDGKFVGARSAFEQHLAKHPGDVVAQVGVFFSQWNERGISATLRSLTKAVDADPTDAYLALSLGELQLYVGKNEDAQQSLHTARTLAATDPQLADIARRADDLQHPQIAPGYPPIMATPLSVKDNDLREVLTKITGLAMQGNRPKLIREARSALQSKYVLADPRTSSAIAIAAFDKDNPAEAQKRLNAIVKRFPTNSTAQLHYALFDLWMGHKAPGVDRLGTITGSSGALTVDHTQAAALLKALA